MKSKICPKCNIKKKYNLFSKNKCKRDGLNGNCKKCESIRIKEYNKRNKEKRSVNAKKYYKTIKDKLSKDYYENKFFYYKKNKLYRENNKEKISETGKRYYKRNKRRIINNVHKYYKENEDSILLKRKQYCKREEVKEKTRLFSFNRRALKKTTSDGSITIQSLKDIWTGKCAYCKKIIIYNNPKTHLDHIIPLQPKDRSKAGKHIIKNVCWCCQKCNISKNNKLDWTPPKN